MKIFPSSAASQVLLNNKAAQLTLPINHGVGAGFAAFSFDGKFILSSRCEESDAGNGDCTQSTAWVSDATTGKEITSVTYDHTQRFIAFSPDGHHVVTTGLDKIIRVWDVFTRKEVAHTTPIDHFRLVGFTPSGKYFVFGGCDLQNDNGSCVQDSLFVWETATGKETTHMTEPGEITSAVLSQDAKYLALVRDDKLYVGEVKPSQELTQFVTSGNNLGLMAFSPDEKFLVFSSFSDHMLHVWEISTGQEVASMQHPGYITSIAFSPDGNYVVSGNQSYSVIIGGEDSAIVWDAHTGEERAHMTHDGDITVVAFSPDGEHVLSASGDGTARVWEASTGKELARVTYNNSVDSATFSPDGKYVLTSSDDGSIQVWKANGDQAGSQVRLGGPVNNVAFSEDSKYVIAGRQDSIYVFETATGNEISTISYDLESALPNISSLAVSPDDKYIVASGTADVDNVAHLWELATGKEVIHKGYDHRLASLSFSPDSKYVVAINGEKNAMVWEVSTGNEVARMTHDDRVASAAFSPDGRYVVSGSSDTTARVWETSTGKEISRITINGPVFEVAFSPDGQHVMSRGCNKPNQDSGCQQEILLIWEAYTGKEVTRFIRDDSISSVAFSPDGKYVAIGGSDHTASIWETLTGKEVSHITHDGEVQAVAFSPDAKYVASGSCDKLDSNGICNQGTARVWNAGTGDEISRVPFEEGVNAVAFSPDGRYVIAGAGQSYYQELNNTLQMWLYRPEDLITDACSRLTRNLTRVEYATYVDSNPEAYDTEYASHPTCSDLPVEPAPTPTTTP
jgi:WD40 repeat protein